MTLDGKRLLLTGVATPDSIAYATAARSLELGARLVLTAFPRDLASAVELAQDLDPSIPVLPLDLTEADQLDAVISHVREHIGPIDGALHAVAFAPSDALVGPLTSAAPASVELAFRTSAWSLTSLARLLAELAPVGGGSLVGVDFDADDRAWPTYNWMGVCKAALRSSARYLARDLGPRGIRVNLVAAGPLRTRAAMGIPGFELLLDAWEATTPLLWSPEDCRPVADVACFLLGDASRVITGEVIHADGGFHAMATPSDHRRALGGRALS
jgi:meromycolic acid enoyl-[acyl-carrier-protein] reductase